MRSRLSIFTFRVFALALATALFLGPFLFAQNWLIPRHSYLFLEMIPHWAALANSHGKTSVIVGDSTARNLHFSEEQARTDPRWINLALGGSTVAEWEYALRRLRQRDRSAREVAVVMSSGQNLVSAGRINGFFPYLMSHRDVLRRCLSGSLTRDDCLRLLSGKSMLILHERHSVLLGLLGAYLPAIEHLTSRLANEKLERESQAPMAYVEQFKDLESFVAFLRTEGLESRFILSPASSGERRQEYWLPFRKILDDACEKLQLQCVDYSERFPDEAFEGDGVHLRNEEHLRYKALIERAFAEEARR